MKCRILTNGEAFMTQKKVFGFWITHKTVDESGAWPIKFKTFEEALSFLNKKYGDEMKLVRKWISL